LPWATDDQKLADLFSPFGTVSRAVIIMDRDSGRSKGFGFVEMENDQEAEAAIKALDGSDYEGRTLVVNEARPREERPRDDRPRGNRPDFRSNNSRPGGNRNSRPRY
jgi:RNA recognition motif-containing protein